LAGLFRPTRASRQDTRGAWGGAGAILGFFESHYVFPWKTRPGFVFFLPTRGGGNALWFKKKRGERALRKPPGAPRGLGGKAVFHRGRSARFFSPGGGRPDGGGGGGGRNLSLLRVVYFGRRRGGRDTERTPKPGFPTERGGGCPGGGPRRAPKPGGGPFFLGGGGGRARGGAGEPIPGKAGVRLFWGRVGAGGGGHTVWGDGPSFRFFRGPQG